MNRQNSQKNPPRLRPLEPVFPIPERFDHDTPMTNEGLETFCDGQLIVVKDPAPAEWMSVDFPILQWHDVDPSMDILVVAPNMRQAHHYAGLTARMEKPCETKHERNRVYNVAGGNILFLDFGSALMGWRFDLVIMAGYCGEHNEARSWEWIERVVHTKIMPKRPIA